MLWEKIDKEGFDDPYVLSIESKLIIENSRYSVKKIDGTSTYKLKVLRNLTNFFNYFIIIIYFNLYFITLD